MGTRLKKSLKGIVHKLLNPTKTSISSKFQQTAYYGENPAMVATDGSTFRSTTLTLPIHIAFLNLTISRIGHHSLTGTRLCPLTLYRPKNG